MSDETALESDAQTSSVDPELSLSREALYNKVWAQPMTSIGKEYGVSSSYLARVCTKLNVPRPERGYWAKLAAGKTVKKPPLPETKAGDELEWPRDNFYTVDKTSPLSLPAKVRQKPARRRDPNISHRLIRDAKKHFLKGKKTDDGYLKPDKKHLVDILVSESSLETALDMMNLLSCALEDFDYRVTLSPSHEWFSRHSVDVRDRSDGYQSYISYWAPWKATVVYVGSVAIGLTLFEISEKIEVTSIEGEYIPVSQLKSKRKSRYSQEIWSMERDWPSGRFCLQAYSPYQGTSWAHRWYIDSGNDITLQGHEIAKELIDYAATIIDLVVDLH